MNADNLYQEEMTKLVKGVAEKHSLREAWNNSITMNACIVSSMGARNCRSRNVQINKLKKKYTKKESADLLAMGYVASLALREKPGEDFLGKIFRHLGLDGYRSGLPVRPYLQPMSYGMVIQEVESKGYCTLNDPMCGTGDRLLPEIRRIRKLLKDNGYDASRGITVSGYETDETMALMCYLQLSAIGVSGYVKVGRQDLAEIPGDRKKCWYTPMYRF